MSVSPYNLNFRKNRERDEQKIMQDTTLDLKELFYLCRKRWKWISSCTLAGFLVLFIVSTFFLPKKYTSTVDLYVNSKDTVNGSTDINTINASQKLVNAYIAVLQNENILEQVAEQLSESVEVDQLRGMLSMKSVNNTEVLQISAETKDPEFSAEICNTIASVAPTELQRVVKAGSVEVVGPARPNYNKTSPNRTLLSAAGLFLGLAISLGVVLVQFLLDNTVKGEDDLRQKFNVPVLGEIPSFDSNPKGGGKRA